MAGGSKQAEACHTRSTAKKDDSAPISVRFFRLGDNYISEASFPKSVRLRELQKYLCRAFKERFPAMMATITVSGKRFDDFNEQPLMNCSDGQLILIEFAQTDDPYFYDLADRKPPQFSIADELAWEQEFAHGLTTLNLTDWVATRRYVELPVLPRVDEQQVTHDTL